MQHIFESTDIEHFTVVAENETEERPKVEVRSILVRDLPKHLGAEQATEALRQLFSGKGAQSSLAQMNAKESRPPVPAHQGSLPQSSWRSNRLHPKEDQWNRARQEGDGFSQRKQLLEQLPHAVSSIRIASDNHGGSIYAVVDFTHELLADLALRLLGKTVLLPGTSS